LLDKNAQQSAQVDSPELMAAQPTSKLPTIKAMFSAQPLVANVQNTVTREPISGIHEQREEEKHVLPPMKKFIDQSPQSIKNSYAKQNQHLFQMMSTADYQSQFEA